MPYLLPTNATPFEIAVSRTTERVNAIPAPIRPLWRPEAIPASLLPFLAWAYSVDVWNDAWPIERKRWVVDRAIWLHRHKGTQTGIAAHLGLVDARLKRAITPPAKTYLMPALTDQERADFVARFPQLRIYPYVATGDYPFANFTTAAYGRPKAYPDACFIADVRAKDRWRRTAFLWDRGVSTALTIRAVVDEDIGTFAANDYDEVILPAQPSAAMFPVAAGDDDDKFNAERRTKIGKPFLIDGLYVRDRFVRVARGASYSYSIGRETFTMMRPGLATVQIEPDSIAEQHIGQPYATYAGGLPGAKQFIADRTPTQLAFLPPTISWRYLYERWHLFDPDRLPDERKRSVHLDNTRLGIPAYNAELKVAITGKAFPREAWRHVHGHLRPHNSETLDRARYATRVSMSARDKILLDTKNFRLPRPGDRIKVGDNTLGQLIEV